MVRQCASGVPRSKFCSLRSRNVVELPRSNGAAVQYHRCRVSAAMVGQCRRWFRQSGVAGERARAGMGKEKKVKKYVRRI